jgi:hypothetical protein
MVIKFDLRHKPVDGDILLTMACPVECSFCIYNCTSSRENLKWMPEETIRRVAEEYSKNDIAIRICGGEPFYDLDKLKKCIDILLEYYNPLDLNIITSAIFAGNKANAIRNIQVIKDKNFDRLIVSADRFHLPRVPLSKIINVIEACRELDIEVILRLSLDLESSQLINQLTKIIVKYQTPIEVHTWGVVGRAEKLDKSPLKNYNFVEKNISKKIAFYGKKYKMPTDYRYYLTSSSKRHQRNFFADFFPTTFPNGNVYGSSITLKSEFMGNINNENLIDMIRRFEKTFSGYLLLFKKGHHEDNNFSVEKFEDNLDIYRNEPFVKDTPDEAIGRRFIKVDSDNDFDTIIKEMSEKRIFHGLYGIENREFLISIRLKEKDLWNKETASKMQKFLNKLDELKIMYVLSRPLPPCLRFNFRDNKQPKNCFECREMFTVKDGVIRFCEPLKNAFGPEIKEVKNRNQIHQYFKSIHSNMQISDTCKSCIYNLRGLCNGLCFVSE